MNSGRSYAELHLIVFACYSVVGSTVNFAYRKRNQNLKLILGKETIFMKNTKGIYRFFLNVPPALDRTPPGAQGLMDALLPRVGAAHAAQDCRVLADGLDELVQVS